MKKILGLTMVMILIVGTLAVAAGKTEKATGPVELKYWFAGNDVTLPVMQTAVADFNRTNAGFTVLLVERPQSPEAMSTAIAGGQGPDVFLYNQNVPWFFGDDSIYPLNEFILDPQIGMNPDSFLPAPRTSVNYGGNVIALPIMVDVGAVKYNRRLVREAGLDENNPPRTWAELERWAQALTIRQGNETVQWGIMGSSVDWLLQEIMFANGGDWNNDTLTEYAPYPAQLAEGLEWIRRLVHDLKVMPVPRGVSWVGAPEMMSGERTFVNEQVAMSIGGHSFMGDIVTNPNLEVGLFPIPRGPRAGSTVRISTGYNGLFIMNPGRHAREGYLFSKWFIENKAADYAWIAGFFPAYAEDMSRYEADWRFAPMVPHLLVSPVRRFHVFPARLDVRSEEPAMVENVLLGRFTPQEAVARFKQHADRVFRENSAELTRFRANHGMVW